jgi:hypothetical protein
MSAATDDRQDAECETQAQAQAQAQADADALVRHQQQLILSGPRGRELASHLGLAGLASARPGTTIQ